MTNKIFYVLAMVFLITSCSKNSEPINCIDDICIDGEWEWVASYGSIFGVTITPETEMKTRKLIIDESHYMEFENDVLILDTEYEYVKSAEYELYTIDSLVLKLASGNLYAVFEQDGQLRLVEPCDDCWDHKYERK